MNLGLLEFAQRVLTLKQQVENNASETNELRSDVKRLTEIVRDLQHELKVEKHNNAAEIKALKRELEAERNRNAAEMGILKQAFQNELLKHKNYILANGLTQASIRSSEAPQIHSGNDRG